MGPCSLSRLALAVCLLHCSGPAAAELTIPRSLGTGAGAGRTGEHLQLALPAWGTELVLSLRRGLRFLAPAFTVEERGRGIGRLPTEHHCFYSGHVRHRHRSFASLSTCQGLVMVLRTFCRSSFGPS